MKSSRLNIASILLSLSIVAAIAIGCRGVTPAVAPTSAPAPVVTVESTATPVPLPTAAPKSTATAIPTPTPEPTEAAVLEEEPPQVESDSAIAERGKPAPDFELVLFDGETVRLSDLRGKIVVLNFWASWCPPCRWEMPDFEEMWNEYGDRDVVFVGVAISDYEEDAYAFAQETGVTYPVGLDKTGVIARAYRPTSMPTTFFIDRNGIVSRKLVSVANNAMLRLFIDGQLREG